MITFEETGWSRINHSNQALDALDFSGFPSGLSIGSCNLLPHLHGFKTHLQLPCYGGSYRIYGGEQDHCLLEKALEHYLSFVIAAPRAGQTAIDIGSCRSVAPGILREMHGVRCYEQDLEYTPGIQGDRIGSSADQIPLPDGSIDFMTLHCTFEHFEGGADTGFVRECARLLKPGGRTIILPLYLNASYCNITGEADPDRRSRITFDPDAQFHCVIPTWQNRFGRHYSPTSLLSRVLKPAGDAGLISRLHRVRHWEVIHSRLWLRWILVLEKPQSPA